MYILTKKSARLQAALWGATLLTSLSTAAMAQDDGRMYANLGLSLLSADLDLSDLDVQGNTLDLGQETINVTMLTGRLGYKVNRYIAIEGDVGFGLGDDDFQRSIPVQINGFGTATVDADAKLKVKNYVGVFARGILPVSDNFDLFVRGGYGTAKATANVTGTSPQAPGFTASASESDSAKGFAYGVGAEYHLSERSAIRADYSGIGGDVQFGSLTYAIKF